MNENDTALAVIIGRAGSKGLPGKNARFIAGRPMICHSIEAARRTPAIDRIAVSTDCVELARAAVAEEVEVVDRPAALADDMATVDAAVRHAVTSLEDTHECIVILYANVPVRPDDLITRALDMLRSTGCDSVQSYADVGKHHPDWMARLDGEGRVIPNAKVTVHRRQDLPRMVLPDGGVIAVRRDSLFRIDASNPHAFLGEDRRGIETPAGAVIDIDDEIDLVLAETLLNRRVATQAAGAP